MSNPELHIARVRSRIAKGGHDIPVATIRETYDGRRLNLIRLMPKLTGLRVYDNTREADPEAGVAPHPKLILRWARGKIIRLCKPAHTPEWAKAILATAIGFQEGSERFGCGGRI